MPRARLLSLAALTAVAWLALTGRAEAQFGALVSPGPLARAHASLEGASNCQKCHEAGRKVTPEKCLTCHQPIAQRIREQRGVHKGVTDCVKCHVDHAGVDGELRPFDTKTFSHFAVTGFALDGKHAPLACNACHKVRSFLTTSPLCVTCHEDVHKGTLGTKCETCHPTAMAFKDAKTAFDHSVTAFPLLGAHKTVTCAECHRSDDYRVPRFSCAGCHKTPHPPAVSSACATCHSVENWHTKKFDHDTTAFPLKGEHAKVPCESCHKQPATKVKPPSATCGACHVDAHKGEFPKDCKSCHVETGWKNAPFDHQANTASHFALAGGHAGMACAACHTNVAASAALPPAKKVVDFRGQKIACASCHADVHQGELGSSCESCHTATSFAVTAFTHPGAAAFYAGQHAGVACEKCHRNPAVLAIVTKAAPAAPRAPATPTPPLAAKKHLAPIGIRFKSTPTTCVTCHADPHLGQVNTACETCHSVAGVKFAADTFTHDRSRFALTGKHQSVDCAQCHKRETGTFPAGPGTAVRLSGMDLSCRSCHADVHLGQVSLTCETCHTTDKFKLTKYTHQHPPADFFTGSHLRARCDACHKTVTAQFPAGRGTAVQFKVDAKCVSCHEDPHKGSLGQDCGSCHKPAPLPAAHVSAPAGAASLPEARR